MFNSIAPTPPRSRRIALLPSTRRRRSVDPEYRLRDQLLWEVTHPRIAVGQKIEACADALRRLASRVSGGEVSADPAEDWVDILIEYARTGGDVASLLSTDERRQATGGGGLSVP